MDFAQGVFLFSFYTRSTYFVNIAFKKDRYVKWAIDNILNKNKYLLPHNTHRKERRFKKKTNLGYRYTENTQMSINYSLLYAFIYCDRWLNYLL